MKPAHESRNSQDGELGRLNEGRGAHWAVATTHDECVIKSGGLVTFKRSVDPLVPSEAALEINLAPILYRGRLDGGCSLTTMLLLSFHNHLATETQIEI